MQKIIQSSFFKPMMDLIGEYEVLTKEQEKEIANNLLNLFKENEVNIQSQMELFDQDH